MDLELFEEAISDSLSAYMGKGFSDGNSSSRQCANVTRRPPTLHTPQASFGITVFSFAAVPAIVIFGIVGNILSLIILKATARSISSHFYLSVLAIFDCLSLLTILLTMWFGVIFPCFQYHTNWYPRFYQIFIKSHWSCHIRLYITFTVRTLSVWTVVILTMERCLIITMPFKFATLGRPRNAKIIIFVLILVSLPTSVYCFFSFDNVKKIIPCRGTIYFCKANSLFPAGRIYQLILHSVLPWSITSVCNFFIIRQLRQRSRDSILNRKSDGIDEPAITRRLLAVSVAFAVLTFPLLLITSVHAHLSFKGSRAYRKGYLADLFFIALVMLAMNFACNFILYCLTGTTFRRAVKELLMCHLKHMRETRLLMDPKRKRAATSSSSATRSTAVVSSSGQPESPRLSHQNAQVAGIDSGRQSVELTEIRKVVEK